jgi:hypothetical protein
LVWIPKYRRKIFTGAVETETKKLIADMDKYAKLHSLTSMLYCKCCDIDGMEAEAKTKSTSRAFACGGRTLGSTVSCTGR